MNKAYVKNASDKKQVKEASRKERDRRRGEIQDMQTLLELDAGRRFLWRMLGHCKVFESIWDSSSRIHHNAGKQDVGHFILGEIVAADETALIEMMRQAKQEAG